MVGAQPAFVQDVRLSIMEREFRMEEGKAGDEVVLDSPDLKFGDKAIRRGFIRKVYMILSVQVRKRG